MVVAPGSHVFDGKTTIEATGGWHMRNGRTLLKSVTPVGLVIAAACSSGEAIRLPPTTGNRAALLIRIAEAELGPGEQVRGARFGPTGEVLYWTRSSVFSLTTQLANRTQVCPDKVERPLAAAFTKNSAEVQVVEAGGSIIVYDGNVCLRTILPEIGRLIAAVWLPDGWISVAQQRGGPPKLWRLSSARQWRPLAFEWPSLQPDDSDWLYLASSDSIAILGTGRPPFWWAYSLPAVPGVPKLRWDWAHTKSLTVGLDPGGSSSRWVGLPVLRTKQGFVQALADLTSEARLVLAFDSVGTVLRRSSLAAPFGLIASSPGSGLILGLATLTRPTLMLYRLTGAGLPTERLHLPLQGRTK